jgi:Ca-activated chloride channel family protein
MRSTGGTDIYASMQNLISINSNDQRPMIVMVITDGRPTTGLVDSGSIIESFSDANQGRMSVFTMGTIHTANAYLLDLMAYRNKGDSRIVTRGRWDIPDALEASLREVSRPVLAQLRFNFAASSQAEVYPKVLSNLYLDRPLVLHGRVDGEVDRLVFQVVGRSGDRPCDMAFTYSLSDAEEGDDQIRDEWAWQKAFYLIGEHTRTRRADILKEIKSHSRNYGIKVPYTEVHE